MSFRKFDIPRGNSKSSDVYSFGIIMQEILYRQGPFFTGYDTYTVTQKVQKIIDGSLKPHTDDFESVSLMYKSRELLEMCLFEDPNLRPPDFTVIKKHISGLTGKTKKNFGEILMSHYERYLRDLDKQVKIRGAEYKQQKGLADQINNRLLPPYVIEKLKDLKPEGKI